MPHWEVDGVDRFNEQLAELARRVDGATDRGVNAGLEVVRAEAVSKLSQVSHPPFTKTPSTAPEPPAMIDGALGRSFRVLRDASSGGRYSGRIGPTKIYSRIQELGGDIYVKTAPFLRWFEDGSWHQALHVYLPPRPYLKPAVEDSKDRIRRAFRNLWASAWRL